MVAVIEQVCLAFIAPVPLNFGPLPFEHQRIPSPLHLKLVEINFTRQSLPGNRTQEIRSAIGHRFSSKEMNPGAVHPDPFVPAVRLPPKVDEQSATINVDHLCLMSVSEFALGVDSLSHEELALLHFLSLFLAHLLAHLLQIRVPVFFLVF